MAMHFHPALPLRLPTLADAALRLKTWSAGHPGAVLMAGLLAFAGPLKFFVGFLGVLHEPAVHDVLEPALWWTLYGAVLWLALLVAGQVGDRLATGAGRLGRGALWFALAAGCSALANVSTAGRARMLVEHGLVQGAVPMQLYGFVLSLAMALLYFAHLGRARKHVGAAARLATAQAGQREARRRRVQDDLQAVQARIDPTLLFGMLEAVRVAYTTDPPRAERLLEELIAFLRACLPRLRADGSSVPREAELARAYVQLLSLAQDASWGMALDVSEAAMHARFPPGALLPLVDDALRARGGECALEARCADGTCRLTLKLPARPSDLAMARAQALLHEIDGAAAGVAVGVSGDGAVLSLWVPHAPA